MIIHAFELSYYKYKGSAIWDDENPVWHGKILDIGDLVTFEAPDYDSLKEEFVMAVDDWLETRKELTF